MSISMAVFCQSARSITRRELADFIREGCLFDTTTEFSPSSDSDLSNHNWGSLEIRYAPGKRPVTVERIVGGTLFREMTEEAIERLSDSGGAGNYPDLVDRIHGSRQAFVLEAGILEEKDDAWEMIDALLAFLAKDLDGIVYADDGLYDRELRPLLKLT